MSPNPTIHRVHAVIFSPEQLREALDQSPFLQHVVRAALPNHLVDKLADPAYPKTCFVAVLQSMPSTPRYVLLTVQIDDAQIAVIAPLASQLVKAWLQQALGPVPSERRFRFLVTTADKEVVVAAAVPFLGDEQDAANLRANHSVAQEGAEALTPLQQQSDFARVIRVAEMRGENASLIDDMPTRERHVVVVRPRDWPQGDSFDGAGDIPVMVQNQLLH